MYTIFYFSGTGNTWLMAKKIEDLLKKAGKEVVCYSIENTLMDESFVKETLEKSEHLILGYPIYGSRAPDLMGNFIDKLPVLKKPLNVAVYCTQAKASGDGANYLEEILKEKKMMITQTAEFNLSNNFYVPVFIRALPVGDEKKINKRNEKAYVKCETFVHAIATGKMSKKKINGVHRLLGSTQRAHMDDYIKKVNDGLYANQSCNKCGLCVSLCPVGNITLEETINFSKACIACMRCYQACPVSAIQITEKSEDIKKYPRYKGPLKEFKFKWVKE